MKMIGKDENWRAKEIFPLPKRRVVKAANQRSKLDKSRPQKL